MAFPCTCEECQRTGAPTSTRDGAHVFRLDVDHDDDNVGFWRWVCSCGGRGRPNYQSDNAVYHMWTDHVRNRSAVIEEGM